MSAETASGADFETRLALVCEDAPERQGVIKAALEILSYQYPQAKDTDPALIIDSSIMKRIEQSGFIKALYKN